MSNEFKVFCHDGSGVTTIEYGLVAAIVAVATIGLLTGMGNSLIAFFESVSNSVTNAANAV